MEYDSLFIQTRWYILQHLSERAYSPLELAKLSNSTISHVSQQLKLLDALGIIKKEKISNRDKGKPRMLFSLARDFAYIVSLGNSFAGKKLLGLDGFHRTMIKIWLIEDSTKHYYIEKFYWKIEDSIKEITSILVKNNSNSIVILIISEIAEKLKVKLLPHIQKMKNETDFSCMILSQEEFAKKYSPHDFYEIYDPVNFFRNIKYQQEVKK